MNLVESIKAFRASMAAQPEITSEKVSWNLDDRSTDRSINGQSRYDLSFVGRPLNSQTIYDLSRFVDTKLKEYTTQSSIIHGRVTPLEVYTGTEQVCNSREGAGFTRDCPFDREDDTYLFRNQNQHTTFRLPLMPRAGIPDRPVCRTQERVACITSYDLDYRTLTVHARILIAPPECITHDEWFDLGTNDSSLQETVRDKIKANLIILTKTRAHPVAPQSTPEQTALLTLREQLTEEEFRRYLKYGFIMVKVSNNRTYQIFRHNSHSVVWQNGKPVEEVCVRIKEKVPATDNVIAFKAMLETSEDLFRNAGNIYKRKMA